MSRLQINLLCLFLLSALTATTQSTSSILVKKTIDPIILDGEISEKSWYTGRAAKDFWQYFPSDTTSATMPTEIYMTYDDKFLYVATKCYSAGDDYIVPNRRRDYRAGGNDNISLMFDPFNDGTNAFLFGMNPYGVQREALISNGGAELSGFSTSWDNKWAGEAKIYDGYWIAEFAIPFKTLRFNNASTQWRFNSYRFDTQSNEQSTWQQIPRNQWIFNLAFMGDMIWEAPLEKTGANISIIPYAAAGLTQDFEAADDRMKPTYNIGGDAKIGITSGLNLDLTFNPDFSQVEVDRQVTNLDRFEIFFPERRQFFLENADLFSSFGSSKINPFFSRRIGIAQDTTTDTNIQNTIFYGARLNGKIGENWRVGLLNMQTAKDEDNGLPSFNYTVAAIQRKVFKRSNIGLILVNKQHFEKQEDYELYDPYNRVMGLDYNLASEDNRWTGKAFYHQAFTPDSLLSEKFAHGLEVNYQVRRYSLEWNHRLVGEGYDAQVGFVRRKNYMRMSPEFRWFFYPENSILNRHEIRLETTAFFTFDLEQRTDHDINLSWRANTTNNARFNINLQHQYTYLSDDFDPTGTDATPLLADSDYNYWTLRGSYNSDRRKVVSFRIEPTIGQYFNGYRYGISGNLNYRYQPLGSIGISYNYNYIQLPEPYATASLFLIGPRIDITFSKSLFLTTFLQYNSQINNLNVNARLQWRFAPVSDLFLVYTDNYDSLNFGVKNRAIVAKLTYWLNL